MWHESSNKGLLDSSCFTPKANVTTFPVVLPHFEEGNMPSPIRFKLGHRKSWGQACSCMFFSRGVSSNSEGNPAEGLRPARAMLNDQRARCKIGCKVSSFDFVPKPKRCKVKNQKTESWLQIFIFIRHTHTATKLNKLASYRASRYSANFSQAWPWLGIWWELEGREMMGIVSNA